MAVAITAMRPAVMGAMVARMSKVNLRAVAMVTMRVAALVVAGMVPASGETTATMATAMGATVTTRGGTEMGRIPTSMMRAATPAAMAIPVLTTLPHRKTIKTIKRFFFFLQ